MREDNLREIKSFKVPPPAVHDVLSCVLSLMGESKPTWTGMKTFLGQSGVVKQIVNFDARQITPKMRQELIKYIAANANSFDPEVIRRASVAAAPLAAWVRAIVKFSEALEKVSPLEDEQKAMEAKIESSQSKLKKCEEELAQISEKIVKLQKRYEGRMKEAARLEESLRKAKEKLDSAQSLIGKLGGEKGRWADRKKTIETEISMVPTTGLLAGAFITYLGGANESKRREILMEWKSLVRLENFKFSTFMCSESQLLKWKGEGLPADHLSIENAIILLNSTKTPLIIDPSTQATEWFKLHLKGSGLTVEAIYHCVCGKTKHGDRHCKVYPGDFNLTEVSSSL